MRVAVLQDGRRVCEDCYADLRSGDPCDANSDYYLVRWEDPGACESGCGALVDAKFDPGMLRRSLGAAHASDAELLAHKIGPSGTVSDVKHAGNNFMVQATLGAAVWERSAALYQEPLSEEAATAMVELFKWWLAAPFAVDLMACAETNS